MLPQSITTAKKSRSSAIALLASLLASQAYAAAPVAYDDVIASKSDSNITLDYLLLNDTDADGNALSITNVSTPSNGELTHVEGNIYQYTPSPGYAGRDSFTYTVSDGNGGTDTATVIISVNAQYDVEAARTTLLAGVSEIGNPTQPSHMTLWGPTAASISNYPGQNEKFSMIAAATLGAGRVIAMPDHQWLNMDSLGTLNNTGTFYQNAITWTTATTSKDIAIVTCNVGAATWLANQGYNNVTVVTTDQLPTALESADLLIAWLSTNPNSATITAVSDFVSQGGALLICDYSLGYSIWWGKSPWDIPSSRVLREAGIAFTSTEFKNPPFTINQATRQIDFDSLTAIVNNPSNYSTSEKDLAAGTIVQLAKSLNPNDIDYARLSSFLSIIDTITPTPQAPVTDIIQRALIDFECYVINQLPPAEMTAHRAALPVSPSAPRVNNASFTVPSPPAVHSDKTIYTPFYAAPGELVTINFPAALTTLNLDVVVSHLRSAPNTTTSYPIMPVQSIKYDVTTTQVQVANPHGGLIQIIVPRNVSWSGTQNITVTGAVEAPYFKLGETTDAEWVAGIRDRGTPFGVLDSPETTLVVHADNWLRTLTDPEAVITEWNFFCGKVREFYSYNPGRQLPVHHDYYPAGGVSTDPQSYPITDEITNSLNLKAGAYSLTLHEYGHICDSDNLQFHQFGETSPNMGGKWLQETSRKYAWKQELVVGRINNYLLSQSDNLWNRDNHHAVDHKGTLFDLLSEEFGADMIHDCVTAMTAMPFISTSQGRLDEWARQLSNRTGFNLCDFFASWQLNVSAAVQTELSSLPDWMPIERIPESLTLVQNTSVTFANPALNDFSYDGGLTLNTISEPTHGTVTNNGDGTWKYTPAANFTGTDSFTYSVTNATGNTFTSNISVHVIAAENDPKLVAFDGVAKGGTWTTVSLEKSYNSMVVVAQPLVSAGSPPLVSRIRNASGSSFEVRLDRIDGSATPVGLTNVRFLVVEEGVYNQATHGIKMEAVKYLSNVTDYAGSMNGTTRNYAYTGYDHYFIPAIFGQVMTSNDDAWSAFWYNGGSINKLQFGKHVGEDPDKTRADETIGFIVMESGSYQFNDIQIQVGVTNVDSNPGFHTINEQVTSHAFSRFPTLHSAQICASISIPWGTAQTSIDGFVAMQTITNTNTLSAYLAEDTLFDSEKATGSKGASYLIAHRSGNAPHAKTDQFRVLADRTSLIDVLVNDITTGTPVVTVTQPSNGTITTHTDGTLIYTPNSGYLGNDSFTYTVANGSISSTAVVLIQVIPSIAPAAGVTADRFDNITGTAVSDLTNNANYPNSQSIRSVWTSVNSGENIGSNYGHRIYGVVVPPTTGNYTFWIASDDASELRLSSDINPANATLVASVSGWTNFQAWDQTPSQKSVDIPLIAGKRYYMEILHKEAGGGDHVAVAWQGPGFTRTLLSTPNIFTASETAPVLASAPADISVDEGSTATVIDISNVFSSDDAEDTLSVEVHAVSNPSLVEATLNGNQLTINYPNSETGSAVITLRATDRTHTLTTASFTVSINDTNPDNDADGLLDAWEIQHFGNITAQDGNGDADADGLNNAGEFSANTNPNNTDSDNDGSSDFYELNVNTDPNSSNSVPEGLYASLHSWWQLNETAGTVAVDSIANKSGTVTGATRTEGVSGNALLFDGINDAVVVSNTASLTGTTDFSLSVWVKVEAGSPYGTILQQREAGSTGYQGEYVLNVNANGEVNFFVYGTSAYQFNLTTTKTINDGQWHHLVALRNGSSGKIYVDGVESATGSGTIQALQTRAVAIGYDHRDLNRYFKGGIDDVRIYSRALAAGEITSLHDELVPNRAPAFATDPIEKSPATANTAYLATLNGDAADLDNGDTLSYRKISGPSWLTVNTDGTLSGTPSSNDVGINQWTVEVSDGVLTDTAILSITVSPPPNQAPQFSQALLLKANARENLAYSGSIASDATDPDAGSTLSFSKLDGPTWLTVAPDGSLSGTPQVGDAGTGQWTVQVSDGTLTHTATLQITIDPLPAPVNYGATGETMLSGTIVDTDYTDTLSSDNVYEQLLEIETGGNPTYRYTYLEHVWNFNIGAGGSTAVLAVEAHHTYNSENDHFVFAYSTDGVNYTDAITVTKLADDNNKQTFTLPNGISGPVWIRVKDTDRTPGKRRKDVIIVDYLAIEVTP